MRYLTLDEAIAYYDSQCPNVRTREEKIRWISEIDERIYEDIIRPRLPLIRSTYTITSADIGVMVSAPLTMYDYNNSLDTGTRFEQEQIDSVVAFTPVADDVGKTFGSYAFGGYEDDTNGETVLIVPWMFKDLYRYWIEKNVDMINREIGAANNAMAMFNTLYDDYFAYYNRNHAVTEKRSITFRG